MAGSANVLTDDSLLSRIDQKLNSFGQFLALISGLAVSRSPLSWGTQLF
jgi:hypothetical protein